MPTLAAITLGCKVNQYETEYVREGLRRLGYRQPEPGEAIDLCIVNTCSVTAEGEAKSRKLIRQFARQNPQAEIIVMGCYASRAAEEVAALPGVVEVLGDKRQLPELLARRGLVDVPTGISSFGRRHRAYVKVQDGCAMECSYCIIPTSARCFPAAIPRTCWRKPAAWWSTGIAKSSSSASTSAITAWREKGQSLFAGTARRVLRTNGDCPFSGHYGMEKSGTGITLPSSSAAWRSWTATFASAFPAWRRARSRRN